jgi:hypothetical protein
MGEVLGFGLIVLIAALVAWAESKDGEMLP